MKYFLINSTNQRKVEVMKSFNLYICSKLSHLFFISILLLGSLISNAQTTYIIHGFINDATTQQPIGGANIGLNNTNLGTSTNVDGRFSLKVDVFPVVLSITHVSYEGTNIIVGQNYTDSLIITLVPRSVDLEGTEIIASDYKVFKGSHMEIIDYDFIDTNLLVLSYNFHKNHHEVILMDDNFDTIITNDIPANKKPTQILSDCMGNCHLLTKDSAFQVYFDEYSLRLIYPAALNKFVNLLGDCLFETPNYIAFQGKTNDKQKLEYAAIDLYDLPHNKSENERWKHLFYFVDKETHEKIIIDKINEGKKNMDAFEQAIYILYSKENKLFFGDILRFEEMTYFAPSFQTMKYLNDTIYYFNHLKSQINFYSTDLDLLKSIKIDYHHQKNWSPVILTDIIGNKAYTVFSTGVGYSLFEINLQDGSIKEVTRITKQFPHKLKVNNGHLYFLYKKMNLERGKRRLYQRTLY